MVKRGGGNGGGGSSGGGGVVRVALVVYIYDAAHVCSK